jgi:hypothetical protein
MESKIYSKCQLNLEATSLWLLIRRAATLTELSRLAFWIREAVRTDTISWQEGEYLESMVFHRLAVDGSLEVEE